MPHRLSPTAEAIAAARSTSVSGATRPSSSGSNSSLCSRYSSSCGSSDNHDANVNADATDTNDDGGQCRSLIARKKYGLWHSRKASTAYDFC